jgi:hypothetical protein
MTPGDRLIVDALSLLLNDHNADRLFYFTPNKTDKSQNKK